MTLIDVIRQWLIEQSQEQRHDFPFVDDLDQDLTLIDGHVCLRSLADKIEKYYRQQSRVKRKAKK